MHVLIYMFVYVVWKDFFFPTKNEPYSLYINSNTVYYGVFFSKLV